MDIFEYVGQNNPEGALKLFRKHSRLPISRQQIGEGLYSVFKNLINDEKEAFLIELSELHPDKKLLASVFENETSDYDDNYLKSSKCNCQHCKIATSHNINGFASASGTDAVNSYMSSGEVQNVVDKSTSGMTLELQNIKQENSVKSLLNDKLFKLVTLGVLAYLFYKSTSKS